MGNATTTRKRAVGTEAVRIERRIIRAIAAAGDDGMLLIDLVRKLDLGEKVIRRLLKMLMDPECKRVYIARWRQVTCSQAVFMLGDLPDAPRPERKTPTKYDDGPQNAEVLAREEIAVAHQAWAATWVPHCDPAAAWIGRAA